MQPSLHTARLQQRRRLKRECFLGSVRSADFPAKVIHCSEWQRRRSLAQHNCAVNLDESLANGHASPWACQSLGSVEMSQQVTHLCSMETNGDTTCECGQAPETTKHMLQCPLLAHPCTLDDLQKYKMFNFSTSIVLNSGTTIKCSILVQV